MTEVFLLYSVKIKRMPTRLSKLPMLHLLVLGNFKAQPVARKHSHFERLVRSLKLCCILSQAIGSAKS